MDILYFLKSNFEELRALIVSLENPGVADCTEENRAALADGVRLYGQLQREYIYPEVKGLSASLDSLVQAGLARLVEIEALLPGQGTSEPSQDAVFTQLLSLVKEHLSLEEQNLMPKIRMTMRTEDREDLGQLLVDVKDELVVASKAKRVPLQHSAAII
jgi:hypothetical protein